MLNFVCMNNKKLNNKVDEFMLPLGLWFFAIGSVVVLFQVIKAIIYNSYYLYLFNQNKLIDTNSIDSLDSWSLYMIFEIYIKPSLDILCSGKYRERYGGDAGRTFELEYAEHLKSIFHGSKSEEDNLRDYIRENFTMIFKDAKQKSSFGIYGLKSEMLFGCLFLISTLSCVCILYECLFEEDLSIWNLVFLCSMFVIFIRPNDYVRDSEDRITYVPVINNWRDGRGNWFLILGIVIFVIGLFFVVPCVYKMCCELCSWISDKYNKYIK
jgi:hypothetical protein